MLKTRIKASNISNLTDARYYAAWTVNWLGLDLRASAEQPLSLEAVKTIKEWIEGPVIVGEMDGSHSSGYVYASCISTEPTRLYNYTRSHYRYEYDFLFSPSTY